MCGLKLNKEKSKLEPMQVEQWLGFVTDTIGMQFGVPPMKIAQLKSDLDFIISSRTVTFRDLGRVSGFINSLLVAVDLIASLFTRQIHSTIQAGWDCTFPISVPLLKGLHFWFLNIEAFDGYRIQPKFFPGVVIFCDCAFGGFHVRLTISLSVVFYSVREPAKFEFQETQGQFLCHSSLCCFCKA